MDLLITVVWVVIIAVISIASSIAKKKKQMEMMAAASRQRPAVGPPPVPAPQQALSAGEKTVKAFLSQLGVDVPEEELPALEEIEESEPVVQAISEERSHKTCSMTERHNERKGREAVAQEAKAVRRDPLPLSDKLTPMQRAIVLKEILGSPSGLREGMSPRGA